MKLALEEQKTAHQYSDGIGPALYQGTGEKLDMPVGLPASDREVMRNLLALIGKAANERGTVNVDVSSRSVPSEESIPPPDDAVFDRSSPLYRATPSGLSMGSSVSPALDKGNTNHDGSAAFGTPIGSIAKRAVLSPVDAVLTPDPHQLHSKEAERGPNDAFARQSDAFARQSDGGSAESVRTLSNQTPSRTAQSNTPQAPPPPPSPRAAKPKKKLLPRRTTKSQAPSAAPTLTKQRPRTGVSLPPPPDPPPAPPTSSFNGGPSTDPV
jgi:hypothetical protein